MCQAHECAKCMALPGFSLDSHKHISTFVWKESDALWTILETVWIKNGRQEVWLEGFLSLSFLYSFDSLNSLTHYSAFSPFVPFIPMISSLLFPLSSLRSLYSLNSFTPYSAFSPFVPFIPIISSLLFLLSSLRSLYSFNSLHSHYCLKFLNSLELSSHLHSFYSPRSPYFLYSVYILYSFYISRLFTGSVRLNSFTSFTY